MKNIYKYCVVFFLMCYFSLTAQDKSEFKLMLSNSIEKMYQNPDAGIKAIKSISSTSDNIHRQLVARSLLSESYQLKANYDEALKMALENVNTKGELEPNDQLLNNIGMIQQLQNLGLYEQSEKLVDTILKEDKKRIAAQENRIIAAKLYQLHAKNLFRKNKITEALDLLTKSNALCDINETSSYNILSTNILINARHSLQKRDYKHLENLVDQLSGISAKHPQNLYVASRLEKLKASILFDQQKYDEAIVHLDSALSKINHVDFLGLKNTLYDDLAKNHLALRHTTEHDKYQKLHQESQNKIDESRKEAIENLMQLNLDFQNQNFRTIEHKNHTNLYTSLAVGAGLLLLMGFWLFQTYQKNQFLNTQSKFLEYQAKLFESQKQQSVPPVSKEVEVETPVENDANPITDQELEKTTKQKSFSISKQKEDEILRKLNDFEMSKTFMDRNMSLAALSTQLEVNTKYLSEVIKKSKGKNFTTYINELKINHIAYLISTDAAYRQYKISYLAELAGFASHSTFSIVFKNVTGVTPNDYIQQIAKRKLI